MFNQGVYWSKRGDGYLAEFERHTSETDAVFKRQENAILDCLRQNITSPSSILEIGVGFGRVSKIVLDHFGDLITTYDAIDVSIGQLDSARKYLGSAANRINLAVADFRAEGFSKKYDIVLASEVFLHFPPDEIGGVLERALALSDNKLIHIDPYGYGAAKSFLSRIQALLRGRPAQSDWAHNFVRLYDPEVAKSVSIQFLPFANQAIFVVQKR